MAACSHSSPAPRVKSFATLAVAATLALTAASLGGKQAVGHALRAAGHAVKGTDVSRRSLAESCGCDCSVFDHDPSAMKFASGEATASPDKPATNNADPAVAPGKPMLGSPSPAPTAEAYWIVYLTDGEMGESYVWWMESQQEKIMMNVLLDTTGEATGLVADSNNTHVIFGTQDGGIWKVSLDGYGLTEIMEERDDIHSIGAMDIDYITNKLYFIDSDSGNVWAVDEDGQSPQLLTDYIDDAYGVAVDAHKSMVFVTASKQMAMYSMYLDGSDVSKIFETPTVPYGLACDAGTHTLFWGGGEAVYRSSLSGDDIEDIYTGLTNATDVTVDYLSDLLFFTDDQTVYKGSAISDKNEYALVAKDLYKLRFIYVVGETPPTFAPTPVPSPVPTSVPTALPTSVPSPVPSAVPTAVPTSVPSAVPTSVPSAVPTAVPTSVPTTVPTSVPTAVPTSLPTSVPTALPTAVPTSVPTALPSPLPTAVPTSVPTAVPTSVPTPAPSSICDYYESQCGLCSGSECNYLHEAAAATAEEAL